MFFVKLELLEAVVCIVYWLSSKSTTTVNFDNKILSEMEVAPPHKLLSLLTLLTQFKLVALFTLIKLRILLPLC